MFHRSKALKLSAFSSFQPGNGAELLIRDQNVQEVSSLGHCLGFFSADFEANTGKKISFTKSKTIPN